MGGDVCQGQTH